MSGARSGGPGPRSRVRRHPERASYDRETGWPILDAGHIAHVAFVIDGQPLVIPMLYARSGDCLLLHGSVGSRLLRHLAAGHPCCASVTHLDGWVLARSQFHHSANYRSVVVFGCARLVEDPERKREGLRALVQHLVPGREETREGDPQELAATTLIELPIEELSCKTRSGGPKDHPDDLGLPYWAGVIPLAIAQGAPVPADDLAPGIDLPDYLRS